MRTPINRRELLLGTGAALLAVEVKAAAPAGGAGGAASGAAATSIPPAPIARIEPVKDTYFGETLTDPYRWMENDKDADWLPFLKGQNEHTRAVLSRIPGRDALLKRIQQLSGDTVATREVQRAGGKLFFEQRPLGADNFKLFVRENGRVRTLVDPTALGQLAGAGHISLDWWSASPDGTRLVYGLSKDGSEDSLLHIMRVADGQDLPDRIPNTEDAEPQWLDDGSGFFYNQLTGAVGSPDRYLDSVARFHLIGSDPARDPILVKRGLIPGVDFERIQRPYVRTFLGARHVLLLLADVRPETRILIAPLADVLANKAHWTAVAGFEDEITGAEIDRDGLYLLANKGAPRGRILRITCSHPSWATRKSSSSRVRG